MEMPSHLKIRQWKIHLAAIQFPPLSDELGCEQRGRERERIASSWEMYDIACRQAPVRSIEEVSWKRRSSDKNSHQSQAAACLSKFAFFCPFNQSKSVNREVWFVLFSHTVRGAQVAASTTTRCEQDGFSFLTPLVHWSTVLSVECFFLLCLLLFYIFSSSTEAEKNWHQLLKMSKSVDGRRRRLTGHLRQEMKWRGK